MVVGCFLDVMLVLCCLSSIGFVPSFVGLVVGRWYLVGFLVLVDFFVCLMDLLSRCLSGSLLVSSSAHTYVFLVVGIWLEFLLGFVAVLLGCWVDRSGVLLVVFGFVVCQ